MKINKYNALRFWEECYGNKQYAEDFHGNLMCKGGYGNKNFSVNYYYNLLTSGKLNSHLADIEEEAQSLFSRLVKEYAEKEGVTEQLKATDPMAWVQRMNNIRERVTEMVNAEVVFV